MVTGLGGDKPNLTSKTFHCVAANFRSERKQAQVARLRFKTCAVQRSCDSMSDKSKKSCEFTEVACNMQALNITLNVEKAGLLKYI